MAIKCISKKALEGKEGSMENEIAVLHKCVGHSLSLPQGDPALAPPSSPAFGNSFNPPSLKVLMYKAGTRTSAGQGMESIRGPLFQVAGTIANMTDMTEMLE